AAMVDRSGEAVYFQGNTDRYLKPSPGAASLHLIDMAREGLEIELTSGLRRASAEGVGVKLEGVRVKTSEGWETVDVTIVPIQEPASLRDLTLVVFVPVKTPATGSKGKDGAKGGESSSRIHELEDELN